MLNIRFYYFNLSDYRKDLCIFGVKFRNCITAVKKLTKNPRTVPFNRIDVGISHLTSYILPLTSTHTDSSSYTVPS